MTTYTDLGADKGKKSILLDCPQLARSSVFPIKRSNSTYFRNFGLDIPLLLLILTTKMNPTLRQKHYFLASSEEQI
jgi:hypothetical protein